MLSGFQISVDEKDECIQLSINFMPIINSHNNGQLQSQITHFYKHHVEGNTKGQYQQQWQKYQLQESDTDTKEHVDWAGSVRYVSEDENEVHPGEEHCKGSYLPLPRSGAPVIIALDKANNEDES